MGNIMNALNAALDDFRQASSLHAAAMAAGACGRLLGYYSLMVVGHDAVPFADQADAARLMQPYLFDFTEQCTEFGRDELLDASLGDIDIRTFGFDALLSVPVADQLGQPMIVAWGGAAGSRAAHAILHSVSIQISASITLGESEHELKQTHIDYLAAVCAGADQAYVQKNGISARTVSRMRQAIKLAYGAPSFEQVVATAKNAPLMSRRTRNTKK